MSDEFDCLDATEKAGIGAALNRSRALAAKIANLVFLPHEPNHTGMMGVFCPVCFELGSEVITDKTVQHMMEFGQVLSLH
jgi:hypothetical protein